MKTTLLSRIRILLVCGTAMLSGVALAQPQPAPPLWKCPGNLVTNAGFNSNTVLVGDGSMPASTTDAWTAAYGTPQLQGGAGCHDPYYVSMWGNQTVGEAIQEPVTFVAGKTYSISFCARYHPDPGKVIPYVNIVLRGSTAPLSSPACPSGTCETITTTANITSQTWNTYTACFTPKQDLKYLTISASNGSAVNDGAQVSFGQVDDVCIREITPPVIDGPANTCTNPATFCVKPPATGPYTWSVNGGTFQNANADGSCILVTWTSLGGSVHVTSTVNGCKVTSDLNVKECLQHPCCDVLRATLTSSELVSGGMGLTFTLSGPAATSVKATVLGASHVWQPSSCGTNGPIAATASSTQPPPPAGWTGPVVPFLNGNQVTWQSTATGGSPLGAFTFNVQLPPTGSIKCNDEITICIEFEVTFPLPNGQCRTCTIVQCYKFKRCPSCA